MESESPDVQVMVVDDSKIDRFIVEKLIERSGLARTVVQKELAQPALDHLKECLSNNQPLPRFIFLDINMPEMSGFEFLDEFARYPDEVKNQVVIVMLSSSLNEDDHKKALSYPSVKMFWNKPVSVEKLETLRQFLP